MALVLVSHEYRHGQPIADSYCTIRDLIRLPMSVSITYIRTDHNISMICISKFDYCTNVCRVSTAAQRIRNFRYFQIIVPIKNPETI